MRHVVYDTVVYHNLIYTNNTSQHLIIMRLNDKNGIKMKYLKYLISTALYLISFSANAIVIYTFGGLCRGSCSDIATGSPALENSYTPGSQVSDDDFISFSYSSSPGSFEIPADLALNRIHSSILPTPSDIAIAWVEIDTIQSGTGLNTWSINTLTDYQYPADWA